MMIKQRIDVAPADSSGSRLNDFVSAVSESTPAAAGSRGAESTVNAGTSYKTSHPSRYSLLMNLSASGQFVAFRFLASHSSSLPVR